MFKIFFLYTQRVLRESRLFLDHLPGLDKHLALEP